MATNLSKVAAAPQNDKSSNELQAQTEQALANLTERLKGKLLDSKLKEFNEIVRPFFTAFVPEIIRLTGNFLDDSELVLCGKIVPPFLVACKPDMEERKRVKEEKNSSPMFLMQILKR